MNGNGEGEAEGENGIGNGEGEAGVGMPEELGIWDRYYPEDMQERLAWFYKLQKDTVREIESRSPHQVRRWGQILDLLGVYDASTKNTFLYHCITIHRERIFPMSNLFSALYEITIDDLKAYPEVYLHLLGEHTEFLVTFVKNIYGLEGYDLELKLDEIIADVGRDFAVALWVQHNLEEGYNRSKTKARISTIIAVVAIAFCTYGASEALGISGQVATAVADAKVAHVNGTVWNQILGWVKVIIAGFKAFLDAIHYDTLVAIHKIAYLVSSDYRETMNYVYGEISKASSALGLGPHYLQLFYQSARVLILDVSTSLGRSYDVAQMEWLSTFNEYLKTFNSRAYRYKDDPALLFYDLEQLVERPALDAKSSGIQAVFNGLNSLLTSTADTVKNVTKISEDIDTLTGGLPENIRKYVEPHTKKITEKVDDFIAQSYTPAMDKLNGLMIALKANQSSAQGKVDGIMGRLLRPADYLLEVDSMSEIDRIDQEHKFSELSNRTFDRAMRENAAIVAPEYEHLGSIADALAEVTITPIEFPGEIDTPITPPGVEPEPRESWFVGDY